MAEHRRVPAAERRVMLIEAGIGIARVEGGRAVTLARVAEACGVTKPIAYRLFSDLADLLAQMQRHVEAEYEAAIAGALREPTTAGASRPELLEVLVRTYVEHSLGEGAVHDTIRAALAATAPAEEPAFALPDAYRDLARDVFGLSAGQNMAMTVMFLGAADDLVAAAQAGLVSREDVVAHLVALFSPVLQDRETS